MEGKKKRQWKMFIRYGKQRRLLFHKVSVCKYPHYYLYLVDNCDWFTHQNRTPKHTRTCSLWFCILCVVSFVFHLWRHAYLEPIVNKETNDSNIMHEMICSSVSPMKIVAVWALLIVICMPKGDHWSFDHKYYLFAHSLIRYHWESIDNSVWCGFVVDIFVGN